MSTLGKGAPFEAMHWHPAPDGRVVCTLCPQTCRVAPGRRGVCGVRINRGGRLYSLIYARPSSIAIDPIEKKPLYHFHPGSSVLSFGAAGCNLKCTFCQNASLSQTLPEDRPSSDLPPESVPGVASTHSAEGVAWTYNEPTIWHEWSMQAMRHCKRAGLYTVYVTNGYISEGPHRELKGLLDAMNIDVKSFSDEFYRRVSKARLQPVLDTCIRAVELGMHLEVTYLVIPTLNDSTEMITRFSRWAVDDLGEDVPIHFSRFHPDHLLRDIPPTPMKTLIAAHAIAREQGVRFVYLGNVPSGTHENTYCPACGSLAVERSGFSVRLRTIDPANSRCKKCGTPLPFTGRFAEGQAAVPRPLF